MANTRVFGTRNPRSIRGGAATGWSEVLFIHRGLPRCEMWKAKNAPVAEKVDAIDSKSIPTGCWFDSSRGHEKFYIFIAIRLCLSKNLNSRTSK